MGTVIVHGDKLHQQNFQLGIALPGLGGKPFFLRSEKLQLRRQLHREWVISRYKTEIDVERLARLLSAATD